MKFGQVLMSLFVGVIMICPAAVHGESPEQVFAGGKALLAKGDFQGALQAFAAAARANRENREYIQEYSMVRRIITLRERLDMEKDPERWEYIARALHAFYIDQGIYSESLALNKKIHARLNTASSAWMLAETQLAMGMNAEAAEVLAGLDQSKATAATRALHGIALAKEKNMEGARKLASTVVLAEGAGPHTVYIVARLQAAIGNQDRALNLLRQCFERVPPSRLDVYKIHAKQSPEFAALLSSPVFAKVLDTKSKIPESKCSGGSKCAGCPMRKKCSKAEK